MNSMASKLLALALSLTLLGPGALRVSAATPEPQSGLATRTETQPERRTIRITPGPVHPGPKTSTPETIRLNQNPPENETRTILFTTGDPGETASFELAFELPEVLALAPRDPNESVGTDFMMNGVSSVHDIFLGEGGMRVGAVGFGTYEEVEGAEDDPRAIYSQIALGNDYRFDVRNSYRVVGVSGPGETAVCDVYYSASINGGTEKRNIGIVANRKDLGVYIAMELDGNIFGSSRRVTEISESIRLRGENEPTLASILAEQGLSEYVTDNEGATPLVNIDLLDEWVENYRAGRPGKVAVLLDRGPFPSSLYILWSEGNTPYVITEYEVQNDGAIGPPEVFESSVVVKRAHDYVFGADWPVDILRNAIVLHHAAQPRFDDEAKIGWDPEHDPALGSITPEEAATRVQATEKRLTAQLHFLDNIYGGGVYVRDSFVEAAPPPDYAGHTFYYKTVSAVRFGREIFYMVYGNTDREALERGEHGGNANAVSVDGRFVYLISMIGGEWIFLDDAMEERIVGGSI